MSQSNQDRIAKEVDFFSTGSMHYHRVDRVRLNGHELVNISEFTCHPDKHGSVISVKLQDVKRLAAALTLAAETELPDSLSAKPPVWKVPYPTPGPPSTTAAPKKPQPKRKAQKREGHLRAR